MISFRNPLFSRPQFLFAYTSSYPTQTRCDFEAISSKFSNDCLHHIARQGKHTLPGLNPRAHGCFFRAAKPVQTHLPWPFFGNGVSMQEAFCHHFALREKRRPLANCGAFAAKPVGLWTKACRVLPQIIGAYAVPAKQPPPYFYPAGPSFFHTSPRESLCFILLHCLAKF